MIDIENELYTRIAQRLRKEFDSIHISGEYVREPAKFPHVTIIQQDNSSYEPTMTHEEVHSLVMFEVNVYSNKLSGKKTECKQIMKIINEEFMDMGFRRTVLRPIPNLYDATIYRMVARYTGVVSKDKIVCRR